MVEGQGVWIREQGEVFTVSTEGSFRRLRQLEVALSALRVNLKARLFGFEIAK
jgi:hypothetical protein